MTRPPPRPQPPRPPLRLSLSSHQRQTRATDRQALHRLLARAFVLSGRAARLPAGAAVAFHLVSAAAIRRLNRRFLGHDRLTDVIAFDYRAGWPAGAADPAPVAGEVFVCPAVALAHARRHRQPPAGELILYLVHGMLHLLGYDDTTGRRRAAMRRAERRIRRQLAREFPVPKLFAWAAAGS